jgi:hypothetical protein
MGIQKQEFYEGAVIHQLLRRIKGVSVSYEAPYFVVNGSIRLHIKHSTSVRTPWGFTFTPMEQASLREDDCDGLPIAIGLVCGSDGIVTLTMTSYTSIAIQRETALRIACSRNHRMHFDVSGPDGALPGKVAPSSWINVFT